MVPLDELDMTSGGRSLEVSLLERRTWWRHVRNVLLALIGLYGGATIGCNLGAPAMGVTHRASVTAVWQLTAIGGVIGGIGLAITARRQRRMFLLWLLFGAGMGAGAAVGAGALGWWYFPPETPVRVGADVAGAAGMGLWCGPERQLTLSLFGVLLGAFLGALLGLGQGRPAMGAIVGAVAITVMAAGAFLLGHPDPAMLFGALVGLVALSFLWQLRKGARVFCKARVITMMLAAVTGAAVFWLQALYWPRATVLVPEFQTYVNGSETRVILSADGSRALALHGGAVYLWDCESGRLIEKNYSPRPCEALGFSQQGDALSVQRILDLVAVWDVGRSDILKFVDLHDWDEPATRIRVYFSPDRGMALVARPDDPFLRELDFRSGREMQHSLEGLPPITSLALATDRQVLIGCRDGSIALVELRGKEPPRMLRSAMLFRKPVQELLVSPNGSRAWASSGRDGMASWEMMDWDGVRHVAHRHRIEGMAALSNDGHKLLTGGRFPLITPANTVELRDGVTGDLIRPYLHHNCTLLYQGARPLFVNLAISADGKWAASIDHFGVVRVWRLPQ